MPSKYTPRGTGNFVPQSVTAEPTFHGTLRQMFETVQKFSEKKVRESYQHDAWERGMEASWWLHYRGRDCAPVSFYARFRKDRIVLAQIIGKGKDTEYMQGRMPKILDALRGLTPMVVVESVVFQPLLSWCHRNEFVSLDGMDRTVVRRFPMGQPTAGLSS